MEPADLRAAAEAVKRYETGDYRGIATDAALEAIVDTAKAYLAEHPADDGEPVTEEWLDAMGFQHSSVRGGCVRLQVAYGAYLQMLSLNNLWLLSNTRLPDQDTRGQVRRLLAALKGGQS